MSDWRPGEPITSRKLNAHSASRAQVDISGPPGSFSKFGQNWASTQADLTNTGMWIRVTGNPVEDQYVISNDKIQKVKLHSWEAIYWNEGKKMWAANPAAYGNASRKCATVCDYDAVISPDFGKLEKTTDTSLAANNTNQTGVTPYFAVRDPVSLRLIAVSTGKAKFNAQSTETVLMILGTYDDYKNCPDVPPSPPLARADYCNSTTGTELCVPAYAYAVYQRCGYVWNKIGDTRTYRVWANELNGGTTSAWRRFHIPRWGGIDTTTGMPDPDDDCMGVAFIGSGASALNCSCPPCLSNVDESKCLQVKFRTIPRPEDPKECGNLRNAMDTYDAWDKEFILELTPSIPGNYCSVSASDPNGIFSFGWDFNTGSGLECEWGPDTFDPCNPCDGFGRLWASIESTGGNEPNCGGPGVWTGEFLMRDICNLLCNCDAGPIKPKVEILCNGCGNFQDPPAIWNPICPESLEITCCSSDSILGGTATSSPPDGYSGGNSTTSYDAFYGGEA